MQSPSFQPSLKSSSQPEGDHIKEDKSKKDLSSEEAKKESIESGSDDETTHMPGSMVESSKKKELKKFDFVTESGEHVHLTKEHISVQKKIEEEVKAEAARREGEIRKEELIDLLCIEVVKKYYNDKLQYDKYCNKMLNRRAASRITKCDVLTKKGPITLKVYREDGIKPGAQTGYKKPLTSSKQPSVSSKEATKGVSSKAPTSSKTGHSKNRKESSSAMDSNPSQPLVSTPVDTGMHKEDQQATASFIIHSESASGIDALTSSKIEAEPGNSAPNDFVPQQQGMNEGTKNTSYDHLFAETSSTIKLEDLAKLVSHVQPSFKDLDSPEDDPVIVVDDSDEDEDDEVHATENVETEDTSVPKSSSL
ncbi:hypothetical protein Tco_0989300, partial [Tanacetum coccineum]